MVYPIRLHLVIAGGMEEDNWDPREVGDRFPYFGNSFAKIFDAYSPQHCINPFQCSTDCEEAGPCVNDVDCPPGYECDTAVKKDFILDDNGYIIGFRYRQERVCRPGSCIESWSADMDFSPNPPPGDPNFPYENCQVLFRVEDVDPSDGWNPDEEIDVIDIFHLDFSDERMFPDPDPFWEYNCGSTEVLRLMVQEAINRGTLAAGGDGYIHVFLIRSISLDYLNCDLETGFTSELNGGIVLRNIPNANNPIFFLALEPGGPPRGGKIIPRNHNWGVVAAHEIGHLGRLYHQYCKSEDRGIHSPEGGNLMCSESFDNTQNAHLYYSSENGSLCDYWKLHFAGDWGSFVYNMNQ